MFEEAPGAILQWMYVRQRMKAFSAGPVYFYECASGTGALSHRLLGLGFQGAGFDLNRRACEKNALKNKKYIEAGRYEVLNRDFFEADESKKAGLVVCAMFLEHWDEAGVDRYFEKCRRILSDGGRLVILVPASMRHWGIEDDIAGHRRRYSFNDLQAISKRTGWRLTHWTGLTYPLSNWLLPLSNHLVNRHESHLRALPDLEKTVLSGDRSVPWKTAYPTGSGLFLNRVTMYPFHLLQRLFGKHPDSLVLYAEYSKD